MDQSYGARIGEGLGGQDLPASFLGEVLDPRRAIDRRSNDRVVEPVACTDIAVEHGAEVQGDAGPDFGGALLLPRLVDSAKFGDGLERCDDRTRASLLLVFAGIDREDRQQAVAHELQDFAVGLAHRADHAGEEVVQQRDDGSLGQGLRQRRKTAHVAEEHDGMQRLRRA